MLIRQPCKHHHSETIKKLQYELQGAKATITINILKKGKVLIIYIAVLRNLGLLEDRFKQYPP